IKPLDLPAGLAGRPEMLERRAMRVVRAEPIKLECVVRGYLVGSGWKEYKQKGSVSGVKLPEGLQLASELPEAIFTPSTKAEIGVHDENVDEAQGREIVGAEIFDLVREKSLAIYHKASDYAAGKGIILADTKFEFGIYENRVILIDEVLTPDSSRYWPADKYGVGRNQESYDKQYVRDYLEATGWDKKPPAPALPQEVIKGTSEKYIEAYEKLTGRKFVR
ncbi:MAG: phosphoribosylaminoimidazolesuccinocarboxamide synthase, partial [Candidatus Micrarchaeota archaeon]